MTTKPPKKKLPRKPPVDEAPVHLDGVTYQQQYIQCSKPACTKWHGPYWYAFFKAGARTKSKYIGKQLPPAIVEQLRALK